MHLFKKAQFDELMKDYCVSEFETNNATQDALIAYFEKTLARYKLKLMECETKLVSINA